MLWAPKPQTPPGKLAKCEGHPERIFTERSLIGAVGFKSYGQSYRERLEEDKKSSRTCAFNCGNTFETLLNR